MKKIFGFTFNVCLSMVVFALLLTSCVHKKQDLGTVVRYFYVLPGEDTQNWQSAVEILGVLKNAPKNDRTFI